MAGGHEWKSIGHSSIYYYVELHSIYIKPNFTSNYEYRTQKSF